MNQVLKEEVQGTATVIDSTEKNKKIVFESYGCQMNFSDSEIVASILDKHGYQTTRNFEDSNLIY